MQGAGGIALPLNAEMTVEISRAFDLDKKHL